MTNEQKLTKLLQVAVENGWNLLGLFDEESFEIDIDGMDLVILWEDYTKRIALNDLVLNWEEGQISFIEALFKKIITDVEEIDILVDSYTVCFRNQWVNLPTSERLDYLFTTFQHLL